MEAPALMGRDIHLDMMSRRQPQPRRLRSTPPTTHHGKRTVDIPPQQAESAFSSVDESVRFRRWFPFPEADMRSQKS